MADTKVELELKWNNNEFFELTSKENDGEPITIIKVEENACIVKLWDNIQALAVTYVAHLLERIGNEMKAD